MGQPSSDAIPRSMSARNAYSPRLDSFIYECSVGISLRAATSISLSRPRWLRESGCNEIRSPADPAVVYENHQVAHVLPAREGVPQSKELRQTRQQKRNIRSR